MNLSPQIPFALSLSKGCASSLANCENEKQGFDKLSPNGAL